MSQKTNNHKFELQTAAQVGVAYVIYFATYNIYRTSPLKRRKVTYAKTFGYPWQATEDGTIIEDQLDHNISRSPRQTLRDQLRRYNNHT